MLSAMIPWCRRMVPLHPGHTGQSLERRGAVRGVRGVGAAGRSGDTPLRRGRVRDGTRRAAPGVVDGAGRRGGRLAVRVRAGRRSGAAGSALPAAARRPGRAERRRRPRTVPVARGLAGPPAARSGPLRAARGHVHAGGHPRRGRRAPGAPRGAGRHPCGTDAAVPVPRAARLGVRGRLPVGGARAVRGTRGAQAVRGPGARAGARGRARRGPQPPRPVRQPPAAVRPLLHRHPPDPVGRRGEPGRGRVRRGPRVPGRQRPELAAGLPAGRSAAGRGARPARHAGLPLPGGALDRGGPAGGGAGPAAVPDRRVRPERPAAARPPRDGRAGAARPVERRLPPRGAHRADLRVAGLLRGLRP